MLRVALVLLLATTAHAGPCDEMDPTPSVDALLQFAVSESAKNPLAELLDPCFARLDKVQRTRFTDACNTILSRDPKHRVCVIGEVAMRGKRAFELLRGWDQSPWNGPAFVEGGSERVVRMYEELGDARGVEVVRETWRASTGEAARRGGEPGWRGKQALAVWRTWRVQAARLFGALGDAKMIEFLEVEARTTDPAVARACADAIRAIRARVK